MSILENNGRFYEKQHANCTNPEALRVLPNRYKLPRPEPPLLMNCQTRREKAKPVKKTGTSAPPRAVGQKEQARNRTGKSPPLPVHQPPSPSLTSLPVTSRPPPASDRVRECDKCHGTGRVSTSEKRASRRSDSTRRMESHSIFQSPNGKHDTVSHPKNQYNDRRPAPPKSLEDYVVVDPSDRGEEERDGWEMDFSMGE